MTYKQKLNHSNCCGARVLEPDICSACKEHCEIENSLNDLTEEDDISKYGNELWRGLEKRIKRNLK